MTNLLNAGFSRLKKDNIFRLTVIFVIFSVSIMTMQDIGSYNGDTALGLVTDDMEAYFLGNAPTMGILAAIFVSLFWGAEYSNGTIRNKLCVGHRRSHVYLAHFSVCLAANLTFLGLWFLCASPMYFFIGPMEMGLTGFLIYAATAVCFTVSFTALFTLVCSMVTNKAYSVVAALGVWMLLQMTASKTYDRLCQPEICAPAMMYLDGEMVRTEPGPNPSYIGGAIRVVLEGIVEFLPTGQALLVNDINIWHPLRGILLSLAFAAVTLVVGVQLFRKKDIR